MRPNINKKTNTAANNQPVAKVRVNLVTASIFENRTENGTFHAVTFDRRYQDADGKWETATSFNLAEVLALVQAGQMAAAKMVELQQGGAA